MSIKLNIGCGLDYREGHVNIDGSTTLGKKDKLIDIEKESLLEYYDEGTVGVILANDIIEHLFHWQAVNVLYEFYFILKEGGRCEIRVPDCEAIIKSKDLLIEEKLLLLFGGQDMLQGNEEMDKSRKKHPNYFCHKYGWTKEKMVDELIRIGFKKILSKREGTNLVIEAIK